MKDYYVYPAVLEYDDSGISIFFPDLPYCMSCANSDDEALYMATDALEGWIELAEDKSQKLPEPSALINVRKSLKENQSCILVRADMKSLRAKHSNKSISKMVSLPQWLISEGKNAGVNFSQVLQDALIEKLRTKR